MAEDSLNPSPPPVTSTEPVWSQVWQLPVLALGLGMFVIGLWVVAPTQQANDFPGALDTAQYYIESENLDVEHPLDKAETKLMEIQPHLQEAKEAHQARFYQLMADLNFEQINRAGFTPVQTEQQTLTNRKIIKYYQNAEELGRPITGRSILRYAQTYVALGQDQDALGLLDQMTDEPAERRYHLVKVLIKKHRNQPKPDFDAMINLVMRFKREIAHETDQAKQRAERIWLAGIEADIKLDAGDPNGTIRLLVMERLPRLQIPGKPNRDLDWASS